MAAQRPGRPAAERRALLVGATGLTGSKLLELLLRSPACGVVHVLARRPLVLRHPKLRVHEVDFASLRAEDLPEVDDVHCCLGTTIRAAGSRAAFREVDHDYVVRVARLARERGATRLVVISAMGADPRSLVFYSRVKGEMEAAVAALGYESVTLLRPSLLAGERTERRLGERLGLYAARAFAPLIPLRYRAIPADAVAAAMKHFAAEGEPGVHVVESGRLQGFVHSAGAS